MKFQSMYTNTSSAKAIVGLLVVTLATAYIQQNATQIVDGMKSTVKVAAEKIDEACHRGQHKYAVVERLYNGNLVDTGRRIWR